MAIGDKIKVHITINNGLSCGETIWAEEIGSNLARVDNIPWFSDDIGFNDIIEYKKEVSGREFLRVVKKATNSWGMKWEPSYKEDISCTKDEWQKIWDHLKSYNVDFESVIIGLFVIALPADKSDEENIIWIKALKYSSPIKFLSVDNKFNEVNNQKFV